MKPVLKAGFAILCCLFVFALLYLPYKGYACFRQFITGIDKVTGGYGQAHPAPADYYALLAVLLLLAALAAMAVRRCDSVYFYLRRSLFYFRRALMNLFNDVKTTDMLILAIPFFATVYFGLTVPVHFDEAATYIGFASKPLYYCMLHYPEPNNHILHSVILHFTTLLPYTDLLVKVRIPAILLSLLTWMVCWSFLKRYYKTNTALFVTGLYPVVFMSLLYGFSSRGYYLVLLFLIIALYAAYNIIHDGNRKKDWLFFSVSSILGFYAMSSFLYPFVTLNVILLVFYPKGLKRQLLSGAFISAAVLLLYSPVILLEGFASIGNNGYVTPRDRLAVLKELFPFLGTALRDISGVEWYVVLSVLVLSLLALVINKDKRRLSVAAVWLLAPVLLLTVHSVIPFSRTFSYYGFILVFIAGISFEKYTGKLNRRVLTGLVVIVQLACCFHFNSKIRAYMPYDYAMDEMARFVLRDADTCFYASLYGKVQFAFRQLRKNPDMPVPDERLIRTSRVGYTSADTIVNYRYVLIDRDLDKTYWRMPVYQNKYQNVYVNEE
ncbi:hypothetical protein [Dysgonomonas termitidis]